MRASLKLPAMATWVGGWEYFDADTGSMGLLGFMEGETPQPGVAELPAEDLQLIKDTLGSNAGR